MYDYVLRLTVMETVAALLVNCPPPGGYHHDDDDHHPHLQGVLEHGLAWHTRPISAFSILAEPPAGPGSAIPPAPASGHIWKKP